MSRFNDRASLQLRAQEIINASPNGMHIREALKRALLERYGHDPDALAEAAASYGAASMAGLRKRTYELPDDEGALFQIPGVIGNRTEDGDLLIPRENANLGQVRQWQKEGQQHHATQLLRFKRAGKSLEPLKEEPADLPWWQARHMLTEGESEGGGDE